MEGSLLLYGIRLEDMETVSSLPAGNEIFLTSNFHSNLFQYLVFENIEIDLLFRNKKIVRDCNLLDSVPFLTLGLTVKLNQKLPGK